MTDWKRTVCLPIEKWFSLLDCSCPVWQNWHMPDNKDYAEQFQDLYSALWFNERDLFKALRRLLWIVSSSIFAFFFIRLRQTIYQFSSLDLYLLWCGSSSIHRLSHYPEIQHPLHSLLWWRLIPVGNVLFYQLFPMLKPSLSTVLCFFLSGFYIPII